MPATLGSYLPLFPFSSAQQVEQWQATFAASGYQAWHLDAGQTSTAFTAYLGYTALSTVVSERTDASGAHVAVGFRPGGASAAPVTSAVIHLVHWGGGRHAPWEVVGTDDTTLSVTSPAYGSTIASPVNVGGRITGVDENIRVQVRTSSASAPVGTYCCLAAGGTGSPWSVSVSFTAPSGGIVLLTAQTGGHVAPVERFAVTGARRA